MSVDAAWNDPDRAVQYEDSDPESLAGEELEDDQDDDGGAPAEPEGRQ